MSSIYDLAQTIHDVIPKLLKLHKEIMESEFRFWELKHGKDLGPYDRLSMLLGDPEFQWLKVLSQSVAELEHYMATRSQDLTQAEIRLKELRRWFFEKDSEFANRLQSKTGNSQELTSLVEEIRGTLRSGLH